MGKKMAADYSPWRFQPPPCRVQGDYVKVVFSLLTKMVCPSGCTA
jgi:hypothetical protein